MAKKVELEFEAAGSLFDDLRAMAQAVGQLRTETGKATEGIQADLKDSARDAQQFSKAVEGGTKVVTALGKAVAQSNTGGFVKNLDAAAAATGRLETSVKGVATQTAKASDELEGIAASARTASTSGKASLTGLSTTAVKSQQDIAKSVKLSAQQYAIVREELRAVGIESEAFTEEIAQAVAELAAAGVQAEDLAADFEQVGDPVVSLQRQLRAAKLEAGALAAEFGIDSQEALKAQQRVASLTDEVGDLTARFDAFNPDKKFEAFNQLQFSLWLACPLFSSPWGCWPVTTKGSRR
jgi:chromosome segregation ATPase